MNFQSSSTQCQLAPYSIAERPGHIHNVCDQGALLCYREGLTREQYAAAYVAGGAMDAYHVEPSW